MSGGDAVELDAGVLKRLVQPVRLALTLSDLRLAIPRQRPQPALRLGRHEARAQQAGLHQLAQPLRPSWFQPDFIALTAIIVALGGVLIVQVNFAALELSSRNAAVVFLWMSLGLVAAIAGATTVPSRGWYPQLLGVSDLGAATAVVATFVSGIKKLGADARSTGRTWRDAVRGRKPPTGPSR